MGKTIDRRKDVDIEIQTACERLSERIHDLKHLQSQQSKCYTDVQQELGKINCIQAELLNNARNKINGIKILCDSFLTKSSLEEVFSNSLKQLSDEHQIAVLRIIEELRSKEQKFQNEIKENLSSLQVYNEEQKSSLNSMSERLTEKLSFHNRDLQKHAEKLNGNLEVIKLNSFGNLQEVQQIKNYLKEERALMKEEQKLLAELQALQEKRSKCISYISNNVENINKHHQDIESTAHDTR